MTRTLPKLLAAACVLALPGIAAAQAQNFAVRFVPIQSAPPSNPAENRCQVRIWVDDVATVYFRNELVGITTQSGRPARDEGTSCSGPLPNGPVSSFRLLSASRPGSVTNVISPGRNNDFTGAVTLQDPRQGGSIYEFEVAWVDARAEEARRFAYATPYRVERSAPGPRDGIHTQRDGSYVQRDGHQVDESYHNGQEDAACQRTIVNAIRDRNDDRNINVEFRANVTREEMGGPRVKIRGNARANSRYDSSRLVYECVLNERNNRIISSAYEVRGGDLR